MVLGLTCAVVVPALDEEASLPLVLADLPREVDRVVVVDNGSCDGTARVAREAGAEVVREPRRGYGSACLKGLAVLAAAPPDVVVFVDADYSDHPDELGRVVAPIAAGEADLVIGSRMLGEREPGALLPQARLGNALACTLVALLYGHRYTDLGPFRALRWSVIGRLELRDPGFGWTVEMQVKALRAGIRVAEVPVSYRRRVGVSKITGTVSGTVKAGAKILYTVFRYARRASRGRVKPW